MAEPSYMSNTGGFPLGQHLEMIQDMRRVSSLKRALDFHASPSRSILEVGCGTGIFLRYALRQYGSVFGIEKDPSIFRIAVQTLSEFGENRCELFQGDYRDFKSDEAFDVVLCELLSTWCIIEDQVAAMRHVRERFGFRQARIIPSRVTNLLELAESRFSVDEVELRTPFLQLTGVEQPVIISPSVVAEELDFSAPESLAGRGAGSVVLTPLADGVVNSVRLSSFVELAPGINWHSSDTLMPQMVFPLEEDLVVKRGDAVTIDYTVEYGRGFELTRFWAQKKGPDEAGP